jgi:hypothetical protein
MKEAASVGGICILMLPLRSLLQRRFLLAFWLQKLAFKPVFRVGHIEQGLTHP